MEAGSNRIDRPANQGPEQAYQHAMRSESETIPLARARMALFIRGEYELAASFRTAALTPGPTAPFNPDPIQTPDGQAVLDPVPYLESCFHRGMALHPVMDSTSPAHRNMRIWSTFDLAQLLQHGDFPASAENIDRFLQAPDLEERTLRLMQMVDETYLNLGFLDFLFDFHDSE
ncbi:MAG: hypothetical protein EBX52_14130 [Proteobacteria bacterium]|nr:hypothetical protein [Pseudomonadota bacterium]